MTQSFLSFTDMSFRYPDSPRTQFENVSLQFPTGWTGIVGPNGAGKTTLLLLAAGELTAIGGNVRGGDDALYCAQRTDVPPEGLTDMLGDEDARAGELRARLGIREEWSERWNTLSHGERKRAQIGVALWREPSVLCIDEPTNHVDSDTRRFLVAALRRYRGIGLLVSHDRELLDLLCARCVMVESPRAVMRPGTYTEAAALDRAEKDQARVRLANLRHKEREIRYAIGDAKREVQASKTRLSKRHVDPKDRDTMGKIDQARLTSKDRAPARLLRQWEQRSERVHAATKDIVVKREYELSLWFESEPARRDTLFALSPTMIPIGGGRTLEMPELVMKPDDRVALTGPNGAGKSTLLRYIIGKLTMAPERLIVMPQEIGPDEEAKLMEDVRGLNEKEKGRVMTVVNLLGSDPKAILASARLSPGEMRKVLLAIGIARVPHLIIMDEPTNHLDLPSIECLTEALAACRCGLLLASHDERFLGDLTTRRWEIEAHGEERNLVRDAPGVEAPTPTPRHREGGGR